MKHPRRFRLALIVLVVVAVIAVSLLGVARYYLTSSRVSNRVADKLQDVLGVPVRIGKVDIGIKGESSLTGVTLYEADAQPAEPPWLTVKDIRTDLSALDVLRGDTSPRRVVLSGAAIELRFDEEGQLLTRLPHVQSTGQPYPHLVLEASRLTLNQEGRPAMVIEGVNAEADDQNGDLAFHGKISDPSWSDWTVEGTFQAAKGQVSLRLKSDRVEVTQEKLESLSFVPETVWRQVKLQGVTPVDLQLAFTVGQGDVHYHIELNPHATKVTIPSIDLTADRVRGKVVIEDRRVLLRDVKGRPAAKRASCETASLRQARRLAGAGCDRLAGDGEINLTNAELDFRKPDYVMTFNIRVENVDLRKLPAKWNIPIPPAFKDKKLTLNGEVKQLTTTVRNGKVHTTGNGKGVIETVFLNQPMRIDLKLEALGDRFQFSSPATTAVPQLRILTTALAPPLPLAVKGLENAPPDEPSGSRVLAAPLEQSAHGLRTTMGGIVGLGTKAMAQVNRWTKGLPPGHKTSYLEAKTSLKNVDLEQLLSQLKYKPPFAVSGKLTITMQVAIPIDTPGDYKAYKVHGDATLPRVNVADVEMKDVVAKVRYEDGLLTLDELHGSFPDSGGDFAGGGKLQLFPAGDLAVRLRVDKVPLNRALALLPGAEGKAEGVLSGKIDAHAPANKLSDSKAWVATGSLHSDRLAASGLVMTKASVELTVKDGIARTHDLTADLEGSPVTGEAEMTLSGSYLYKGQIELKDADLAALHKLSEGVRPPVTIKGQVTLGADFEGQLTPSSFTATGTAQAKELTVADVLVDALTFKWSREKDRLRLRDIDAKLYDGKVSGKATVPLKDTAAGDADLKIQEVDAQKLAKASGEVPFKIEGRVSGTVSGTLGAAAPNKGRELTSKIELAAPKMRVQGVATQKVHATVNYGAGGGNYRLEGEALGGTFELEGKLPPVKEAAPAKEPEGRLRLQGLRLSRLGEALGMPEVFGPLAGRIDLDLPFHYEGPDRRPVGVGRLNIHTVRWGGEEIAESLRAEVRLTPNELRVGDISGSLGEGSVRGTISLNLKERERSRFSLHVERLNAERILGPFLTANMPSPTSRAVGATTSPLQGALEIQLRGRLGSEWRAEGYVSLTRGKIFGADISEWRVPLTLAYAPSQGTGQLDFSDNHTQLARGRVQGRATLRWGSGLRLEGALRFFDVDLPTLLRSTGEASKIAAGRATGRLDFNGDNIRSTADLNATLDASFAQAQPLQLPILEVLVPYVAPGQSTMTFQKGDVRATLRGGVVRVKRLTMSNPSVQMVIEGTVTLANRLDLDVTAHTGAGGLAPLALQLAGLPIPAVGPIPSSTLVRASALFANRVVHLRVTGTLKNPSVQIDTARLLTEEAVRFFAGAALGVPLP